MESDDNCNNDGGEKQRGCRIIIPSVHCHCSPPSGYEHTCHHIIRSQSAQFYFISMYLSMYVRFI